MTKGILTLAGLLVLFHFSDGSCTLPTELSGTWIDSRVNGTVLFQNLNVLSGWMVTINTESVVTYTCVESDDTRWVFRSDQTLKYQFGLDYYAIYCFEYTKLTDYSYSYYVHSDIETNTNTRVFFSSKHDVDSYTNISQYCNDTHHDLREMNMLIKDGQQLSAHVGQYFPNSLLGVFSYTIDDGSNTIGCDSGSLWDGCYVDGTIDRTTVSLNYSVCNTRLMNSVTGVLYNVANVTVSSTDYVMLMTIDGSNTHFTCVAVTETPTGRSVSTHPGGCTPDQSSNTRINCNGCKLLTMTVYETCLFTTTSTTTTTTTTQPSVDSSTSSDGSNIGAILGVIIPLLLLIIIVIVSCLVYQKYFTKRKHQIQRPISPHFGLDIKKPIPLYNDFTLSGLRRKSVEKLEENDTVVHPFRSHDYDVEAYIGEADPIPEKPRAPPVFLFTRTPTAIITKMTRYPKQSNVATKRNLVPLPEKPKLTPETQIDESSNLKPLPPISGNWMSN